MEPSAEMVSKITDRILPEIKEWQSRPLNPVCPFVFMDCIHYKAREDGRILSRAAYIVLGITVGGCPAGVGEGQREMGKEISLCCQQLGKQLGGRQSFLPVPG